jgi:hypothetical protein
MLFRSITSKIKIITLKVYTKAISLKVNLLETNINQHRRPLVLFQILGLFAGFAILTFRWNI